MRSRTTLFLFGFTMIVSGAGAQDDIRSPEEFLGFPVGADYRLARWDRIVDYFKLVDRGSERVLVEQIGVSTEGNPYLIAVVSSPETIRNLERYKNLQRKLSHPNELQPGERERLVRESKVTVLVSCSLHSSEIGASQMSMELLHQLATGNDPGTMEILENDIILLVPSANPDGIDKVIDWYESTLGTPWEGQGMPWLYQKYVGHDNNRDWYMLTQKETQILTRVLYHEWYPCIIYDIHQMGRSGCRFFAPPFFDPVNPNVDPLIHESLKIVGGHMATELAENGKRGVLTNGIYDNWWQGGNRTTPYRHNIVGILTEAASPRIASPVFQPKSELRGHSRGLPEYAPQVNFTDPWDGGWWRLRDVVEYEKISCYALFTVAARYRDRFNGNYLALGEKAIRLGKEEPPFAFVIPQEQRDLPTTIRLLEILRMSGIEIDRADEPFTADGIPFDAGAYIVYAAQPYRNHVKDLLEAQDYPDRFVYPGGPAEPPYDVAGWTLSYQMGVDVVTVERPFEARAHRVQRFEVPKAWAEGRGSVLVSSNRTTNDFILLNRAFQEEIAALVLRETWDRRDDSFPAGSLLFCSETSSKKKQLLKWARELGVPLRLVSSKPSEESLYVKVEKPRVALYQPWFPSKDEGWTRFVLEQFEFDYTTIHNAEIRAGNLHDRYDVIILPDVGASILLNGMKESTTAPQYVGGIAETGVMYLQEFVAEGGGLLCLDSSCAFAIDYFDLPIRNVLADLERDAFFCPGSILRVNLDTNSPIAYGADSRAAAYFAHSYAFEVIEDTTATARIGPTLGEPKTVAEYDSTVTLLSGWILGEEHLQGKAAIVSNAYGKGQTVLYGFRVQHRGQPHGTFRLLFNGILFSDNEGLQ